MPTDLFGNKITRSRPSFSLKDKEILHLWQGGKCAGCSEKLPVRIFTVDHIKALDKGGTDKPSNLQLLCGSCNSTKGNGTQARLQKRLQEQGVVKGPTKSAKVPASKTSTAKGTTKARSARKR